MSIRILVADDHAVMREGIISLLESQSDLEVIGSVEDGRAAVAKAGELLPDVVLMDAGMPRLNGIDATQQIRRDFPSVAVVILTMHTERHFVREARDAGAIGFVLKRDAFKAVAEACRMAAAGASFVSAGATAHWGRTDAVAPKLTLREREVLQLLAEGENVKEIGLRLGLSHKTVETHRSRIMARLGLHSLVELTRYAIQEGLTDLGS